jgi:hypothetical protein
MPFRPLVSETVNPSPAQRRTTPAAEQPLDAVAQALAGMRFGVIQLTVHDGRLVQLDVTERRRFA